MNASVLADIRHKGNSFGLSISMDSTIMRLKENICSRWPDLTPLSFRLSYVQDSKHLELETDSELQSFIAFRFLKNIELVEIFVDPILCLITYSSGVSEDVSISSSSANHVNQIIESMQPLKKHEWGTLITGIGQRFVGGAKDFRVKLRKYCLSEGYTFKFLKNDKYRVTAECKKKLESGCKWRIHASLVPKSSNAFELKRFISEHTCGVGCRDLYKPQMTSAIVASCVVGEIRDKPEKGPIEIVNDFKRDYGIELKYHFAQKGKEGALIEIHGDDSLSYHQLVWYVEEIKKTNPGSFVILDSNPTTRRFEKLFIAYEACLHGFQFCRPMLFLDGTHLTGKFKGCLLSATSKDANQGLFPLAMAVVNAENDDNWLWFLSKLSLAITTQRNLVFISDKNSGLVKYIPQVFPNSYHGYCLWHLMLNLTSCLSGRNSRRGEIVDLFKKSAYAATHTQFTKLISELKIMGGEKIDDFLARNPYEKWANAYFPGNRYGEMSSGDAESFNSWILKARSMPILPMLDTIRIQLMERMSQRREASRTYGFFFCPTMEKRLKELMDSASTWRVTRSNDFIYEVHSPKSHVVDLQNKRCTCNIWQVYGFPCEHAVQCISMRGEQVYSYSDPYFSVRAFQLSYSRSIQPMSNSEKPVEVVGIADIVPPITKRPPGRPNGKRKASIGESSKKKASKGECSKKSIKCSRCQHYGHNRTTCKEAIS